MRCRDDVSGRDVGMTSVVEMWDEVCGKDVRNTSMVEI